MKTPLHQNINGDPALVAIDRAINELRCGRAVYCRDTPPSAAAGGMLLAAAETTSAALLARLENLAGDLGMALAITRERAHTLGLAEAPSEKGEDTAVLLQLRHPVSPDTVALLAGSHAPLKRSGSEPLTAAQLLERVQVTPSMQMHFNVQAGDAISAAALRLAKQARLLPTVLLAPSPPPPVDELVLGISCAELNRLALPGTFDLEPISEARVPLAGHEDCRLVLFRDGRDASEHIAIVVGSPQTDTVPVRLHSACLTGDLLGSLRCDCGDQLRRAVDQLAAAGGGVLLYLAQEGRGIGLANKLRAYELQDAGLDTIEADAHLGFLPDERSYAAAASMLQYLGLTRIHLLTNNLEKIEALQQAGIEVVTGQRLLGTVNRHNVRYIRAKRERAGHLMPEVRIER
jgi:GTP cyclohydrolase II